MDPAILMLETYNLAELDFSRLMPVNSPPVSNVLNPNIAERRRKRKQKIRLLGNLNK
jgi:hypothetical protein